jgi:putative ABC transport system substrate-binding protein
MAVGLVASLNRPGGNVTGITSLNTEVVSKRLELLHEVVPKASIIGLLVNQADPRVADTNIADMQAASRSLALQIHVLNASSSDEIDEAFATLAQRGIGALVVTADSFFNSRSQQLAALVLRYALPAITAELPVLQSTKVELVINLRTAKLLGLAFPIAVLGRADEVIE